MLRSVVVYVMIVLVNITGNNILKIVCYTSLWQMLRPFVVKKDIIFFQLHLVVVNVTIIGSNIICVRTIYTIF